MRKGFSTIIVIGITVVIMGVLTAAGYYYLDKINRDDKGALQSQIDSLTTKVNSSKSSTQTTVDSSSNSSATSPGSSSTPATSSSVTGIFSLDNLKNAYYSANAPEHAQMKDGTYYDTVEKMNMTLDTRYIAYFRNTEGNVTEAAVVINGSTGGTGVFKRRVLFGQKGDGIAFVGDAELGDRVQIQSLSMPAQDQISMPMLDFGPDDPACCPTVQVTKIFKWTSGTKLIVQ